MKKHSYEKRRWQPIEWGAVNAYLQTLNAYRLKDSLSPAYSSILNEYRRRFPAEDQNQHFISQRRVNESHRQEEQSGCAYDGTSPHNGQGKVNTKSE